MCGNRWDTVHKIGAQCLLCLEHQSTSHEHISYLVSQICAFAMTLHYTIQHLLVVVLFSSSVLYYTGEAQVLNCQKNETKFEKLIGLRPNVLQKNTLLFSSRNNTPVTLECLSRCANSNGCTSFLLFYNTSECYSYVNISMTTQNYDYDSRPDTNVVWFRKTCLNVPDSCKTKAWTTEILAGATLIGFNTKRIANKLTRQRCIQSCMDERSFQCKSIKFTIISNSEEMISADPVGTCVLSAMDRHLTPSGFRVSRYEDEYIENHCVNTTHSSDYCAYEEYDNTTLEHVDLSFSNTTQEQCQGMCDTSLTLNCRGYSLVSSTIRTTTRPPLPLYTCLLHSEDSKLIGPKLLIPTRGAKYFERARCLNVSVSCSTDSMIFTYHPEQSFTGRIYTSGYSDTPPCYTDGRYNATVTLIIPFNHTVCGSTEAISAERESRTLKSVLLVIQYNALIQTQADRLIKVGCVYSENNNSQDEEITVDTSVNFTSAYPNRGSTIVNSSSLQPIVTMRIVDYNSQKPTGDTEIGQELQMIIEITPGDGPYDIWAGNLTATSGNNTIQLLDVNGCPTYLNIFLPFTKIQTNSSKKLVSTFQAFKFPSTQLVRFSVMVHFCTLTCPPMECVNQETENRAKRETQTEVKEQLTNDSMDATLYKLNDKRTANNNTDDLVEEMPLDILLIVRGVNIVSDQLVVGENRILVAGYDYVTNEVCVDYSLFIGLLVTWVLLQVIIVVCCFLLIRKYKKYFHIAYTRQLDDMHQNFGFGSRDSNRRVHWADQ